MPEASESSEEDSVVPLMASAPAPVPAPAYGLEE